MKFMVTWSVEDEDKWLDILDAWSSLSPEQRADVGYSVKMIGRWHDLNSKQGVAIMGTSDLPALMLFEPVESVHVNRCSPRARRRGICRSEQGDCSKSPRLNLGAIFNS